MFKKKVFCYWIICVLSQTFKSKMLINTYINALCFDNHLLLALLVQSLHATVAAESSTLGFQQDLAFSSYNTKNRFVYGTLRKIQCNPSKQSKFRLTLIYGDFLVGRFECVFLQNSLQVVLAREQIWETDEVNWQFLSTTSLIIPLKTSFPSLSVGLFFL